jgi:probable addiction module antidote protein
MKKARFAAFDAADYLKTEQDIAAYLKAASEEDDPQVLVAAMGSIVRARNVTKVAKEAGMTREGVYKAFSTEGNPSFATVVKVAKALDFEVSIKSRKTRTGVRPKPVARSGRIARLRPGPAAKGR